MFHMLPLGLDTSGYYYCFIHPYVFIDILFAFVLFVTLFRCEITRSVMYNIFYTHTHTRLSRMQAFKSKLIVKMPGKKECLNWQ